MKSEVVTSETCPNLIAEILCHNTGSVYHCAKICDVPEEEMYAFLKGERAIGADKLGKLAGELCYCSKEYLKCNKLSYYNMEKKKHRRKLLVLKRKCKCRKLGPVDELIKRKIFLRAWYNNIIMNEKMAN